MLHKIENLMFCVLVGWLLASGTVARAADPEVVITDDLAPHLPVTQFVAFSTTLSATVKNKPESNAEAQITGPTFQWSLTQTGNDLKLTSYTGQSVGLYVEPLPELLPMYHSEGWYSVTIKATARFTKTLLTGTNTVSYIDVPAGQKNVSFFVRKPKEARNNGKNGPIVVNNEPIPAAALQLLQSVFGDDYDPNDWTGNFSGFIAAYSLDVRDNQSPAQIYPVGVVNESLSAYNDPDGDVVPKLKDQPSGAFADINAWFKLHNELPEGLTEDTVVLSFTQAWHHTELAPPFNIAPVRDKVTVLKPAYELKYHVFDVIRNVKPETPQQP